MTSNLELIVDVMFFKKILKSHFVPAVLTPEPLFGFISIVGPYKYSILYYKYIKMMDT